MAAVMPEKEDDPVRREEQPYPSTSGEDAGEGVVEARERAISVEQYEGGTTWGDLQGISLRKVAEGLVRIEQRVIAIEERMATKEDLQVMATKQDLEANVVRIEERMATKEDLQAMATKQDLEAMATKQDLQAMVTKQDLNDAMMSILRWNVSLTLAGIAIMAGVTIGIIQVVIANFPQ